MNFSPGRAVWQDSVSLRPVSGRGSRNAHAPSLLAWLVMAALPVQASAADWASGGWHNAFATERTTSLIELRQGSDLSNKVKSARGQGYETAGGDPVNLSTWYSARWTDVRISWLTHISKSTGIIWGMNTGERGEKYSISPGIKLGFIHQARVGRNAVLTLRATTTLGSRLRERTCTADYGAIGGIQAVNCRLAATELDPQETLSYLFNETSRDQRQISVTFNHAF